MPGRVRGIAFTEAIVKPVLVAGHATPGDRPAAIAATLAAWLAEHG